MRYLYRHVVVFGSGFVFMGLFLLLMQPLPVCGENTPAMVEKHIFSPETVKSIPLEDKKSPAVKQIERQIMFTGVIISANGRRAMMRKKTVRGGGKQSELYKEGDEINGMTIKEIGSNYVILGGKGKNVKLNLYQGAKMRPAPPAMPTAEKTPEAVAGRQPAPTPAAKGEGIEKKPEVQAGSPKIEEQISGHRTTSTNPPQGLRRNVPSPSNPFLKALRRAAGKKE